MLQSAFPDASIGFSFMGGDNWDQIFADTGYSVDAATVI
jgi:hypothetical protein